MPRIAPPRQLRMADYTVQQWIDEVWGPDNARGYTYQDFVRNVEYGAAWLGKLFGKHANTMRSVIEKYNREQR